MNVTRYCKAKDLNWATLPELLERLRKEELEVISVGVTLYRRPDQVTYKTLEEAGEDVRREGHPDGFGIDLDGPFTSSVEGVFSQHFRMSIHRLMPDHEVQVIMNGVQGRAQMDMVTEFLGLEPVEPPVETVQARRPRTAFIAHKFDRMGEDVASKLARFLTLLGFRVVTGRPYSPRRISEKVLSRIEDQELLFAVLTPGDDNTWLTQEQAIAKVEGKPLFLIKDERANFKSGILGDHEYIAFTEPDIEAAFVPVLEGLLDLGYLEFR